MRARRSGSRPRGGAGAAGAGSETVTRFRIEERSPDGTPIHSRRGGLAASGYRPPPASDVPAPEGPRINMLTAIRRTLEAELRGNPRMLLFGEDVGPKGGVHAATLGLQDSFGTARVFDTSLSEEGIIGRAVGMALAGLMPVPEIQFRKYADPATEQLNNCGTMRWRTNNRWAAPIVVRLPGGYAPKCGDPHSVCGEAMWAHAPGWQVVCPRTQKTRSACCALQCEATTPRFSSSIERCSTEPGHGGPIPEMSLWCRSGRRERSGPVTS